MHEPLAQSVEQQPFKLWVVGSNPTRLTTSHFARIIFLVKNLRPHRLVGPGHKIFILVTGVRIPLGTPNFKQSA
jgi:hypothetical protein